MEHDKDCHCHHHAADADHAHAEPARRTVLRRTWRQALVGMGALLLAAVAPRKAHAGAGRCSKCNCPQFEGTTYQCANCGHQYADHW